MSVRTCKRGLWRPAFNFLPRDTADAVHGARHGVREFERNALGVRNWRAVWPVHCGVRQFFTNGPTCVCAARRGASRVPAWQQ
jgi:hypothetical protein